MNRSRTTTRLWTFFASRMLAPVLAGPLLVSLVAATVTSGVWLATPAWADTFFFSTGTPDRLLGALSAGDTETADDFILTETTSIAQATICGLIPSGTPLANITNVEVEVYHTFPLDSGPFSGKVPSRKNSPADVEIDSATRDGSLGTLGFTASLLNPSFSVLNTVVNDIVVNMSKVVAAGEGPASGEQVQITITFTPPILLAANVDPDHYFFRPDVRVSGGDFLYLSAPKPIVPPGTPFPPLVNDLQAWIRDAALGADWLRIGTDIIGPMRMGVPTFNMTFSLTGETVPEAGTPGRANCHGKSVSALAHQFGGLDAAASALGFSSVEALQETFGVFCEQ